MAPEKPLLSRREIVLECLGLAPGLPWYFTRVDSSPGRGESLDIKQLRQLPGALTIRWTFGILLGEHGLSQKSASEIEKRLVAPIWFP